jgi:DNA-binding NarL/FixJ family response regulator
MNEAERHYYRWNPEEIASLREMFRAGCSPCEIARRLQRTENAVVTMISTLELKKWQPWPRR